MITQQHMNELWQKFKNVWGKDWTELYGETPYPEWICGLEYLPEHVFNKGVTLAIEYGKEKPPNLVEFRNLCLGLPTLEDVTKNILSERIDDMLTCEVAMRCLEYFFATRDADYDDFEDWKRKIAEVYPEAMAERVQAEMKHFEEGGE